MTKDSFAGGSQAERRRFRRRPLKLRVRMRRLDKEQISSEQVHAAEDLGTGGIGLRVSQALPVGQLLMLTLLLPAREHRKAMEAGKRYSEHESQSINVLSRVAWCAPAAKSGYLVGVQFLDLDREERKLLRIFLEDYELYHPDNTLNL